MIAEGRITPISVDLSNMQALNVRDFITTKLDYADYVSRCANAFLGVCTQGPVRFPTAESVNDYLVFGGHEFSEDDINRFHESKSFKIALAESTDDAQLKHSRYQLDAKTFVDVAIHLGDWQMSKLSAFDRSSNFLPVEFWDELDIARRSEITIGLVRWSIIEAFGNDVMRIGSISMSAVNFAISRGLDIGTLRQLIPLISPARLFSARLHADNVVDVADWNVQFGALAGDEWLAWLLFAFRNNLHSEIDRASATNDIAFRRVMRRMLSQSFDMGGFDVARKYLNQGIHINHVAAAVVAVEAGIAIDLVHALSADKSNVVDVHL